MSRPNNIEFLFALCHAQIIEFLFALCQVNVKPIILLVMPSKQSSEVKSHEAEARAS